MRFCSKSHNLRRFSRRSPKGAVRTAIATRSVSFPVFERPEQVTGVAGSATPSLHLERFYGRPAYQVRRDRLVRLAVVTERPALRASLTGVAGCAGAG